MRTIKFRGKRVDNGEWVTGYVLFSKDNSEAVIAKLTDTESICENVNPDTVGQFTGRIDQNGKEIYEGDILIEPNIFELPRHVFWDDRFARWGNISPTTHGYIALHDYNEPEIIGNIHDNPELLEQGV